MHLDHLWLTDFRSYAEAEFSPAPAGITVVTGANGAGKTNLIEAIGYLATLRSLRGSPAEAMVRSNAGPAAAGPDPGPDPAAAGPDPGLDPAALGPGPGPAAAGPGPAAAREVAIVRAEATRAEFDRPGRRLTIEAELHAVGRDRVRVNGQPLRRTRDLLGALQVTVFSPDDLALVKGGPAGRREYLDDLLVALHPRHDALIGDVERILRQRGALLKSAGSVPGSKAGRDLPDDIRFTLDVWDAKLSEAGEQLAAARAGLVADLGPLVAEAYAALAAGATEPGRRATALGYRRSWAGPLADALAAARLDDVRRGVTTVGPHRDDLDLAIGGLAGRTHASQGEQRSLALALRLAGHRLVAGRIGGPPVLLLDDVFSELDHGRSEALLRSLPEGQAVLTTAGDLPAGAEVAARFRVEEGKILP